MLRLAAVVAGLVLVAPAASATSSAATGFNQTTSPVAAADQRECRHRPESLCGHVTVPLDRADASAGSLDIGYQLTPATGGQATRGTILAVEGGPGYSSIGSTAWYRDLFQPLLARRQPLLARRQLLIVDLRGTGRSGAINCPWLQSYQGNYVRAVGACGRRLWSTSDLYVSLIAARDVVAGLDHLGIDTLDVYGDSYGTFFA